MAINISQAFHRTSANPIDDTLALTKAEMLTVNDNLMPSKYLTVCQDDGQIYLYDKTATPSAETGKFILFEAGGGGSAPIGTVIAFMGTTAPTNYVACDGTVYNISDYPKLANFFEQQFGTKNHFGGNGTTTFAVPNLNGEFLRGTGTNGHTNQGNGANVGVHQDATEIPRSYAYSDSNTSTVGVAGVFNGSVIEIEKADSEQTVSGRNVYVAGATNVSLNTLKYTARPTNTSVLFCICARTEETQPTGHEYSTTEKVVGTWIDGKPIYEVTVLNIDSADTSATTGTSINIPFSNIGLSLDMERVVSLEQVFRINNSATQDIYTTNNAATTTRTVNNTLVVRTKDVSIDVYNKQIGILNSMGYNMKVTFTIRYTKTTD